MTLSVVGMAPVFECGGMLHLCVVWAIFFFGISLAVTASRVLLVVGVISVFMLG